MKEISDQVVIVTNAASETGRSISDALAHHGAQVVAVDSGDQVSRDASRSTNKPIRYLSADLRDDQALQDLVRLVESEFGGLNAVVHVSAPPTSNKPAVQHPDRRTSWLAHLDEQLFSAVMLTRAAQDVLSHSENASVVHVIHESHAKLESANWIETATNGAFEQITRSQALDLANAGVRVNTLRLSASAPNQGTSAEALKAATDAVMFLCSHHAGFVTGSTMPILLQQ